MPTRAERLRIFSSSILAVACTVAWDVDISESSSHITIAVSRFWAASWHGSHGGHRLYWLSRVCDATRTFNTCSRWMWRIVFRWRPSPGIEVRVGQLALPRCCNTQHTLDLCDEFGAYLPRLRGSLWGRWMCWWRRGFVYDPSIFPAHHDLYRVPGAERFPFRLRTQSGKLLEFSSATVRMWRLPSFLGPCDTI